MLFSGHWVPGEDEEPCVICGGFYKPRRAWKWWDEILAKGRNEESIRNALPFSPLLFFLTLSVFGTAAAITLLYRYSLNLTCNSRVSDRFLCLKCEDWEHLSKTSWIWRLMISCKLSHKHSTEMQYPYVFRATDTMLLAVGWGKVWYLLFRHHRSMWGPHKVKHSVRYVFLRSL